MADTETQVQSDDGRPESWFRSNLSAIIVLSSLPLLGYVIVRNEPIEDAMFSQIIRVYLSVVAAMVARDLPGYLDLNLGTGEQQIKAVGSVAVFVLTYLGTPYISPTLNPDAKRNPPVVFDTRASLLSDVEEDPLRRNPRLDWLREYFRVIQRAAASDSHIPSAPAGAPANKADIPQAPPGPAADTPNAPQTPVEVPPDISGVPETHNKKTKQTVLIQTHPFAQPYKSFTASVVTPPTPSLRLEDSHTVIGFLVPGKRADKAFVPLIGFYDCHAHRNLFHVPESNAGDYLFFILHLQLTSKRFQDSSQISVPVLSLQ